MAASGYECEFVESVQEFECPLCLHVTREPHQTNCCGHDFCQSCINCVLTDNNPCPFCRTRPFTVFNDRRQRRRVLELKVYCTMKDKGCSWIGELGEFDSHLDTKCQYIHINCTSCGKTLQRRLMRNHRESVCPKRAFTCKYCGYTATYEDVRDKHWPVCTKYPLLCPNNCGIGTVERGSLGLHLRECPLQLVQCKFSHVGCSEKIRRRDMRNHLQSECSKRAFTCKYCGFMATFEDVHNKHMPVCTMYPLPCPNYCGIGTVERGYIGVHCLLECPFQLVPCEFSHVGCSEQIRRKDIQRHMESNMHIHLVMTSTALSQKEDEMQRKLAENDEELQEMDLCAVMTSTALRKLAQKNTEMQRELAEKDKQMLTKLAEDAGVQRELAEMNKEMQRKLAQKDKQIEQLQTKIRILEKVQLPPVEFTVHNFSRYEGQGRRWNQCPLFYTHPMGAKIKIALWMTRYGRVEVELWQVLGEFDKVIKWPMRCTVTVQILNQKRDENHLKYSKECELQPTREQLITHIPYHTLRSTQHDAQYVKDDRLCVIADIADVKP